MKKENIPFISMVYILLHFLRFFKSTFINTPSSAAPQISLCRKMLRSIPRLLRLKYWQSDAGTYRM
jgi:hypothetical protein